MDPGAGRIVLHGHFAEVGFAIAGGLAQERFTPALAKLDAEIKQRVAALGSRYHGLLVFRLEIAEHGGVVRCTPLWDRIYALGPDAPPFRAEDVAAFLLEQTFPPADQPSRVILPISIGPGLG